MATKKPFKEPTIDELRATYYATHPRALRERCECGLPKNASVHMLVGRKLLGKEKGHPFRPQTPK